MRWQKGKKGYKGKGKALATIYRRPDGTYRLYWRVRVDGKPRTRIKDFTRYAEAKHEDDQTVADLASRATWAPFPWIQVGRLVRFDWPSVYAALLRRQRRGTGGQEPA